MKCITMHSISHSLLSLSMARLFSRIFSGKEVMLSSFSWLGDQNSGERESRWVVSDSLRPHRRQSTRLLCPRASPGTNPGVGCHAFLQGIFLTQGLNPDLLYYRRILYHLSHRGSPQKPVLSVCFKIPCPCVETLYTTSRQISRWFE